MNRDGDTRTSRFPAGADPLESDRSAGSHAEYSATSHVTLGEIARDTRRDRTEFRIFFFFWNPNFEIQHGACAQASAL
jgi:hypothetical protein